MIIKGQLLSATNLNNAYISKSDTNAQSINSTLTISGGALTLKNSIITDNASSSYMRIDPQGNNVIIYDGVNNQRLDVFSSSGSESTYLTTINGTKSFGQIDVSSAIDHLEINTNSHKPISIGGIVSITSGNNLNFIGNSSDDAGDIVFQANNGTEIARIYSTNPTTLNISTGTNADAQVTLTDNAMTVNGTVTATGGVNIKSSQSLSFSDYGGGFNMQDTTWIRTTGSKSFYQNSGTMRTDGTFQVGNAGSTLSVTNGGNFNFNNGTIFGNTSKQVGIGTSSPRNTLDVQSGGVVIGVNLQTPTSFSDGTLSVGDTTRSYSGNMGGESWGGNGDTITLHARDYSTIGFLQYNQRVDYIRGGSGNIDMGYDGGWGRANILFNNGIWNSGGSVGVGTQSPSYPLHIKKTGSGTGLYVENTTGSNDTLIELIAGGDSSHMIIQTNEITTTTGDLWLQNTTYNLFLSPSTGKVGIGTTQPQKKLDIVGDIRISGSVYGGTGTLNMLTDAGGALPLKVGSIAVTSSYSNSAPTNGIYVQGNAGFGTTSPSGKIHVSETGMDMYTSSDHLYLKTKGTNYPYIGFLDSGGTRGGYLGFGNPGSYINLILENGNNLYIDGGNVGIGTATPSQKLDVVGSIKSSATYLSNSDNDVFQALGTGSTVKTFRYDNSNFRFWNSSSGELMTLTQNTRVGINQPSPSYMLDVNGDISTSTAFRTPSASNSVGYYVGNDSALWDINVSNTLGVYGQSNTAVGAIKLGSTGPVLYGTGGALGLGTTSPSSAYILDTVGNIRIGSGNGIYSGYNNNYILKDHGNANITLSATGAHLYLGYQNTTSVYLSANLQTTGGLNIADTSGKLYYNGTDTNSTYLRLDNGNSMSGDLTFGRTATNIGIVGNSQTWTKIDPNGQRFIIQVPITRSNTGDLILSVEDTTNWTHNFELNANGNVKMNGLTTTGNASISGTLNMNNNIVSGITQINGQYGTIAKSTDEWLRLNDDGSHTSGIYFGSSIVRTDGQLQVGSNGSNFLVDISGNTTIGNNLTVTNAINITNGIKGVSWNAGRSGNSYMYWNANSSNDYGLKIGVDGKDSVTIYSDPKIMIGSERASTAQYSPSDSGYTGLSTTGWYNIAHNPSGDRATGSFTIMDVSQGNHSLLKAEVAFAFGVGVTFSCHFTQNYRAGNKVVTALRVVYNGSNEYWLQAWVNVAGASVRTVLTDNYWDSGWQLINWTTGTVPTGYNYDLYDVTDYDRKPNVWSGSFTPTGHGAGVGDIYIQY